MKLVTLVLQCIDKLMFYTVYGIVALGILVASGCSTPPVVKTVTQVEFKAIDLPEVLLKPCHTTAPPEEDTYMKATFGEREEHLTNYIVELLADMKVCNAQIGQLKLIRDEQIKTYRPKPEVSK